MAGITLRQDPLAGHPTYETVQAIGRGRYTFVYLARNRQTGQSVKQCALRVSWTVPLAHHMLL